MEGRRTRSKGIDWSVELPKIVDMRETALAAAKRLKVHKTAVYQAAAKAGIALQSPDDYTCALDIHWLPVLKEAQRSGEIGIRLAERLKVSEAAVYAAAKAYGIKLKDGRSRPHTELARSMLRDGKSNGEIAAATGLSSEYIANFRYKENKKAAHDP